MFTSSLWFTQLNIVLASGCTLVFSACEEFDADVVALAFVVVLVGCIGFASAADLALVLVA